MSGSKSFNKICVVITILAVLMTVLFMNATALGIEADNSVSFGYEDTLFDDSYVHTIDIAMDDWDDFIENATSEEYRAADVTIDGEKVKNVGVRAKGNTSLSTVSQLNSQRYSLKLEFDCYSPAGNYHGLDKLCLNNLIQDYTMMKDYLAYKLMGEFGAASPLVSFCFVTVNGEDWGLYLAAEAVEDSFLKRNYGTDFGALYKPDSMDMGGGRGNGRGFDMRNMDFDKMGMKNPFERSSSDSGEEEDASKGGSGGAPGDFPGGDFGGFDRAPGDFPGGDFGGFDGAPGDFPGGDFGDGSGKSADAGSGDSGDSSSYSKQEGSVTNPSDTSKSAGIADPQSGTESGKPAGDGQRGGFGGGRGGFDGGPGGFGMGSSDAKLQYIDDDVDSYSTIFNSAKTNVQPSDKRRLIKSLKALSEGIEEADAEKIESAVNIDEVLRYMVVHSFVVNGDSYIGSMIHNYYLYEEDGLMSMIPWDYNLAFGTFQAQDASGAVNDPIDTPLSVTEGSTDRPMFSWITSCEEFAETYHTYYQEFLEQFYTSGVLEKLEEDTAEMLRDYVDRDPTKFCTTEEFDKAVETMRQFLKLRCESIEGQLSGSIPSTDAGQEEVSTNLIDASSLTLSDMGSMGGGGGGFPGNRSSRSGSGESRSQGGFQPPADRTGNDGRHAEDSLSGNDAGESPSGMPDGMTPPTVKTGEDAQSASDSLSGNDAGGGRGGMPGGFPGGSQGGPGGGMGGPPGNMAGFGSTVTSTDYLYTGISAAAMLAALAFALAFRRTRRFRG